MPLVEIPDVGEVEFPDEMSSEDISREASRLYVEAGSEKLTPQTQSVVAGEETEPILKEPRTGLREAVERARQTPLARRILGPSALEREGMVGSTGSPGEILATALKFATVPEPVRETIRPVIEAPIQWLPVSQPVKEALLAPQRFAMETPIAPIPAGLGKAALGGFGVQFALSVPEQKEAYDAALARGDYAEATRIGASFGLGTGLIGVAGAAAGIKSKQPSPATEPEVTLVKPRAEELAVTKEPVPSTPAPEPVTVPPVAAPGELAKTAERPAEPPAVETVKAVEPVAQPEIAPVLETPTAPTELTHPILGLPESVFTEGKLQSARMRNDPIWQKLVRYFGISDPKEIAAKAKERFDSLKKVGITPPGFEAVEAVGKKLDRYWQGVRTAFRTSGNKQSMAAHIDAADNSARIEGRQRGNSVRVEVPNVLDREAVTFIVESKGDPAALDTFLSKVQGKDKRAEKAVRHAIDNYGGLAPKAELVSEFMERQRLLEETNGIDTDYVEGYIKHAYDMDVMMGINRPVILAQSGAGGVSTAFKKQRAFETYADAVEAGYKPTTFDSAALVDSRVNAGMRLINRRKWGESLRDVVDPTSGEPIVTDMVRQPKGTEVAPSGYVPREILPGIRVAVQEGYQSIFDALTGASRIGEFEIKGIPVGRIALRTEGAIKHGLLFFDTFHMSRIMQKELFLRGKVGWNKGLSLLEYSNADLANAVRQELITPQMADYVRSNRATADALIKEGLNVGQIQEALYADIVKDVPIVGRFNKWVFQKMTRGAMMESALIEFERVQAQHPEMTNVQVARRVAGDVNVYFGNLGRQGVFKSKTFQDLARLVFLAPQWVESMATTELKGYGQMAKVPIDSIRARQLQVGTLAKGMSQGLAAYFVATQLLNLSTRGQFTWDNQEKGHKLDAWIPDVTGETPGFFLSPFSVPAELTHDMIRYSENKGNALAATGQIAKNKLSPLSRAASTLLSQEDYSGTKIYGTADVLKETAWSLAPTPIPLSGPIKGQTYPGQMQRQLLGSAGIKVEPTRKEVPMIVKRWHIASREGFEEYLNSLARKARTLPPDQQALYLINRLHEDELAPKYMEEARKKLILKLRQR